MPAPLAAMAPVLYLLGCDVFPLLLSVWQISLSFLHLSLENPESSASLCPTQPLDASNLICQSEPTGDRVLQCLKCRVRILMQTILGSQIDITQAATHSYRLAHRLHAWVVNGCFSTPISCVAHSIALNSRDKMCKSMSTYFSYSSESEACCVLQWSPSPGE